MNHKAKYKQLLNLSIEEFDNKKNKTIQEITLYLYHQYKVLGKNVSCFDQQEICEAYTKMNVFVRQLLSAIDEISETICCEACKARLLDFKIEFIDELLHTDIPLMYVSDYDACFDSFLDTLSLFYGVFLILDDWDYDLGKLLVPNNKKTQKGKA